MYHLSKVNMLKLTINAITVLLQIQILIMSNYLALKFPCSYSYTGFSKLVSVRCPVAVTPLAFRVK